MSSYETDEEQVEAIKKWWAENGRAVIAGIVLGLGAIFGWRGWISYEQGRNEAASVIYEQSMTALADSDAATVQELGERLMQEYADTPYAEMVALVRAKASVEGGDLDAAQRALQWAVDNADQPDLSFIARLRLARVQYADNALDTALKTLDVEFPASYTALVEELRGDILADQGEVTAARSAYQKALLDPSAVVDRGVLEMKLNDLGAEPGATS